MDEERRAQIAAGLAKLDPADDGHWTARGLPALAAVRSLSGLNDVVRAEVAEVSPGLTREEVPTEGPESPPEAPEAEAPAETTSVNAEALLDAVGQAEADLLHAQEAQDAINEEIRERQGALDNARAALRAAGISGEPHHIRNMRAIQRMLARSRANRAARASERQALIDLGVPKDQLISGSPIDRAMAAKRGRPRPKSLGGRIKDLVLGDE